MLNSNGHEVAGAGEEIRCNLRFHFNRRRRIDISAIMSTTKPTKTKTKALGFHILEFNPDNQFPSIPAYLYLKKHAKHNEYPVERTLFIMNLPMHFGEPHVQHMFTCFGKIQKIILGSSATSKCIRGRVGHLIFKDVKTIDKVFQKWKDSSSSVAKLQIEWGNLEKLRVMAPPGLDYYLKKYHAARKDIDVLQAEADTFMREFNEKEEEVVEERTRLKEIIDEDGFQTVVRNTKKATPYEKLMVLKKKKTKVKSKELKNFYRYQMREKKQEQLQTLRHRFQQDVEKINQLKQANLFQPELS